MTTFTVAKYSVFELTGAGQPARVYMHDDTNAYRGYIDFIACNVEKTATSCAPFTIIRHTRNGYVDDEARRRMAQLTPHIRRSLLIGKVVDLHKVETAMLADTLDGLAAVPPYGDRDYRTARGGLALAAPGGSGGIVDLDGFYGLNPALAPLHDFYARRELLVVHAVATPYRDRSHFDGQDLLENGTTTPHEASSGWLNRAIGLMPGALPSDHASRHMLNTTAIRLPSGHSHFTCPAMRSVLRHRHIRCLWSGKASESWAVRRARGPEATRRR